MTAEILVEKFLNSGVGKTHNISVNRICHGGYPLKTTEGENKINKSGSEMVFSGAH